MSVGSKVVIERINQQTREYEEYLTAHLLDANPTRSREIQEDAGEFGLQTVTFVLRYRRALEEIQYAMPDFRILWRGHYFDIRGYDDFKFRHLKVTLKGVSNGEAAPARAAPSGEELEQGDEPEGAEPDD